jgi:hypothetical protein
MHDLMYGSQGFDLLILVQNLSDFQS